MKVSKKLIKKRKLMSEKIMALILLLTPTLIFFILISLSKFLEAGLTFLLILNFILGIKTKKSNSNGTLIAMILGIFISLIQIFFNQISLANSFTSFIIYYWAWLSIHNAGLQLDSGNFNSLTIHPTLIQVIASLGTVFWIWTS